MTKKQKLFFTAFIFTLFITPVSAQESDTEEAEKEHKIELYSLGDQSFSISAGLLFPLFYIDPTPDGGSAISGTNTTLGGTAYLTYEAYLNNNLKAGLELGGMFAYSPNKNPTFMVPITARFGYEFHFGRFSMPVYLGTGINIITYGETTNVQFLLKPGISLYWNYNSNWGFGGNLVYWFAPDIVGSDPSQTRLGNFLDFTISAQYHF